MGASIGMAHGLSKSLGTKGKGKVVGVLGDSTFIHSGITSLLNTAYNRSNVLTVIADNRTTAMTGMQQHPGTGWTLQGEKTVELNFETLAKSLGIPNVRVVDPYDLKGTRAAVREELGKPGPSLIISRGPCVLLNRGAVRKSLSRSSRKNAPGANCVSGSAARRYPGKSTPRLLNAFSKESRRKSRRSRDRPLTVHGVLPL